VIASLASAQLSRVGAPHGRLDLDAWYAMIAAERAAVGISKDGHELPEEHPTPSGGARAPMLDGLAAAVGGVPGGEMELVN
jgi:hypothetical protein